MATLFLTLIYVTFISLGLPDSLLGVAAGRLGLWIFPPVLFVLGTATLICSESITRAVAKNPAPSGTAGEE